MPVIIATVRIQPVEREGQVLSFTLYTVINACATISRD